MYSVHIYGLRTSTVNKPDLVLFQHHPLLGACGAVDSARHTHGKGGGGGRNEPSTLQRYEPFGHTFETFKRHKASDGFSISMA